MKISNKQARHTAIYCCGLHSATAAPCNTENLIALVKYLGYVQLDPLQVITRAHDHILWSRNTNYRPQQLTALLEKDRLVFEHFCHDACVLPTDSLPYWKAQFKHKAKLFPLSSQRNNLLSKADQKKLIGRIVTEGALCSNDFKSAKADKKHAIWTKPAHKQTLDFLWLTGVLAVSRREKFTKYYDLAERIYPQKLINTSVDDNDRLAWLTKHALQRLGFASAAEIKQFWAATTLDQTKCWCERNSATLPNISVESCSGEYSDALTHVSNVSLLNSPQPLSKKLRIINPFDPLVRDRKRLKRLFNFDFRIEIYIPPEKRQYGYYVYPLLEYDKFVGRIEVRHDRTCNTINVDNLWHEENVKFGKQRMQRLCSELERLKRFCNAHSVQWSK